MIKLYVPQVHRYSVKYLLFAGFYLGEFAP